MQTITIRRFDLHKCHEVYRLMPSLTVISAAVAYVAPHIQGGDVVLRSVEFPQTVKNFPAVLENLLSSLQEPATRTYLAPAAASPQTCTDNPFLQNPILTMILLKTRSSAKN